MNFLKKFFQNKITFNENITHIYDLKAKESLKLPETVEAFKHEHIYIDHYVLREKDNNLEAETLYKAKLHELCEFLYDTNFYVVPDCHCSFGDRSQLGFDIRPLYGSNAKVHHNNALSSLHDGDYVLKINKNKLLLIKKEQLDSILCVIKE